MIRGNIYICRPIYYDRTIHLKGYDAWLIYAVSKHIYVPVVVWPIKKVLCENRSLHLGFDKIAVYKRSELKLWFEPYVSFRMRAESRLIIWFNNHKRTLEEKFLQICLSKLPDQQLCIYIVTQIYIYNRHTNTVNGNMHKNEFDKWKSIEKWKIHRRQWEKEGKTVTWQLQKRQSQQSQKLKKGWVKFV